MSQDNMVKMQCEECKTTNYYTRKNKRTIKDRLLLRKLCNTCGGHKGHKETK